MKVYTSADSTIIKRSKVGDGKKGGPTTCNQPGLILFGTTIPALFFDVLSPKLMLTGLGSRCLFIGGDRRERHNTDEIVHAFIHESGLETWNDNELLVDWIAAHLPAMAKASGQAIERLNWDAVMK